MTSTPPGAPPSELAFRLRAQFLLSLFALAITAIVAWYFLVETESAMRVMRGDGVFMDLMWMMMRPDAAGAYLGASTLMWVVMMIAMMVPAVVPMMVVFQKLDRGVGTEYHSLYFACGYLVAWSGFSVIAAGAQWLLHGRGLLGGELLTIRPLAAAAILMFAGFYQLTPYKNACLEKCRSPFGFFLANSRPGGSGAFAMGLHHGLFCIGCCWVLMLIMFVGGAMSVITMAALCVFILAERLLPPGPWVARLPGFGLMLWAIYLAASTYA